jgi:ABC-type dipeptide/oligopeptide/nickel transport system permease subunit
MTDTKPASFDGNSSQRHSEGLWRLALRRLFRQRSGIIGMILLGFLVFLAIFAPIVAPYDPIEVLIGKEDVRKRDPPCIHLLGCPEDQPQHIMGIDGNVRDEFSRIVYGTRISLTIGFATIGLAILVGASLGAVAGYAGGATSDVIMRILDVVLAFPFLLLAIAIVAVLGPGLINAMLAIAIVNIPIYARVMRSSVLSVKEDEYVAAARSIGSKPLRILTMHILPNSIPPLIVAATLGIASAILETAALSFLGMGAQPPQPEWGAMLASERNQVFSAPHLVFFPGFAIMLTVLGFNLLGDGLRDALDPRLRL